MKISFTLNGLKKTVHTEAGENVQALLQRLGIFSVRDSDDHQGFCGSDTIILNGNPLTPVCSSPRRSTERTLKRSNPS